MSLQPLPTRKSCQTQLLSERHLTNLRALKLSIGGECRGLNPNIPTDIETEADLLCRRVGVFTTNLAYCMPFTMVPTRGRLSTG